MAQDIRRSFGLAVGTFQNLAESFPARYKYHRKSGEDAWNNILTVSGDGGTADITLTKRLSSGNICVSFNESTILELYSPDNSADSFEGGVAESIVLAMQSTGVNMLDDIIHTPDAQQRYVRQLIFSPETQ